jgi:hypothetical protein
MYTRKHHKEESSVRGRSPRWKNTFSIDDKGGEVPDGKIPFPLMTKGERFIRCRGQRHGSRGSMSDITSVLHDMISVLY